jgi:hypothetical protein
MSQISGVHGSLGMAAEFVASGSERLAFAEVGVMEPGCAFAPGQGCSLGFCVAHDDHGRPRTDRPAELGGKITQSVLIR